MKFAKVLLTVSFFIYVLLGITPRAMSRDAVPGQRSGTSDPSTVNPTNRDKALDGLIILYGTNNNANTSIPPPPMQKLFQGGNYLATEESQFIVTYDGFTDEAMEAFQYAVDIWNSLIRSPVPIRIDASFTDFGGFEDGSIILGGARPAGWKSPRSLDLWFPEALADKRASRDLSNSEPDIITRFNSHEEANWYFGIDGNTPSGKTDFVSTVLHEIAHGFGFTSFATVENSSTWTFSASAGRGMLRDGNPELPQIYDFFVENGSGTTIMSSPDPSFDLENQLTSNDLFWNGKKGVAANGGILPHLYAPSSWSQGSSYTHLDEITFPAGNANALMTPYLDNQEAIHNPGPIALGMLEDMEWIINKAPVFTDGSSTIRTVTVDRSIGSPVVATDANNDTLTYQLSGTDAAAFDIDSTTGQLKTKAAHNYNTKASYTVTVTVSDGTLIDEITVTINIISTETETPTNSRPSFVDGSRTSLTVAENTAKGVNIGNPIAATDTDNDALTYTLSGPDAASFDIDKATGQLKTNADLDYEKKNSYTVTVTVSDGSLTITITVIIIIIDLDDQESPTLTLVSQPLTETSLNGSIVILTLSNRIYENWLSDPVTVSGIPGVTVRPFDVTRLSDTELSVQLTFYGTDLDTDATLTFTVKADAIANYDGPDLTTTTHVTANAESVVASTVKPLTETTLNGSVVTLTLNGGIYESQYTVGNSVTVSGITGVTVNRYSAERLSGTQVNVELIFDGTDFDTDTTLTITVGADAVKGYNGTALIAQLPVSAVIEETPRITAYATQSLTETTLNESIVTLTLSTGIYTPSSANISSAVQVSGIAGVTFLQSDVVRVSDTKVTVKLTFDDTDFDTNTTLTFRVGANAIANYDGSALITAILVTAVIEESPTIIVHTTQPLTEATLNGSIIRLTLNNGTYVRSNRDIDTAVTVSGIAGVTIGIFGVERVSDTDITFELEFNGNVDTNATLTFTVGSDAIAEYEGPALIAHIIVNGGQESVVASTETPLTETTLNGSIVTLTLNGATYERSTFDLRDAVSVSGIEGVTFHWFDLDRISDTKLTVELTFRGNIDTDTILTFTVGADAIAEYEGPALIAQITVTGGKESVGASTAVPLTEATLDGSTVILTLNGRTYERSIFRIRNAVEVSGIKGVTIGTFGIDRVSDTVITVELTFNGDFDADTILTFTVGANALLRYNGPALTTQLPVTGGQESIAASTEAPLTEATLDESVVTLTLSGRKYARSIFDIRGAVSVSGIDGVTIPWHDPDRKSDTQIIMKLEFNGDIDADAILTFTVAAGAIAGYNGPALTTQITVTGGQESIVAATKAPLTEATLDGSVITLTLSGRKYARSTAVTVSGIEGVTVPWHQPDRKSDTQITIELEFNGNIDTDTILTFTVGAGAIANYNGPALTAELSVTGGQESVAASTDAHLTEATLHESVVTLTLNGAKYASSTFDIRDAVSVSGIIGVTIPWHQPDRKSDTQITIELEFNGDIDTDTILTFTVGAGAIAGYDGPALTAQITVTGAQESIVAATKAPLTEATLDGSVVTLTLNGRNYVRSSFGIKRAVTITGIDGLTIDDVDRNSNTEITVELEFNGDFDADATLTFTVGAGAITGYDGPALTTQITVTGGQESIVAATKAPLTEATLDGSVVTLTLSGRNYVSSSFTIERAVTITGIDGLTIDDVDRNSNTEITVELEFNGDFDADATLTFTVGAGAIAGYNGPALTTQIIVTGGQESIVAATKAPLTEATLDGSVVTLTLSGRNYVSSSFTIERAVTITGIDGLTIDDVDRNSNTEITVELEFNGDFDADATLTFTVGAGAITGYDGPALTTQITIAGGQESIVASTDAPLTEATLDESVVTLTLNGRKYAHSIFGIRRAVSVSGIDGVTIPWHQPDRKSDTQITIELEFNGDIDTEAILTFTVGAGAIAGYNGPALTTQITVTAIRENALLANFPNPFNPETWIPYQLAKPTAVTITIYAVNGQAVRTLTLGHQPAGIYQSRSRAAHWDGRNAVGESVASGVYFYMLTAGDFTATRKMLIQK